MRNLGVMYCSMVVFLFNLTFMLENSLATFQKMGRLDLGFKGAQMNYVDVNGIFLLSNSSNFAFGFKPTKDATLYLLVVIHQASSTVVWSANRGFPVRTSDYFVFDYSGNAYLQSGGSSIWSTNTASKGVTAMELLDSGNLVVVVNDGSIIWQSFSHPTDTLLSNQSFIEGMKLVSNPNSNNLSYSLEFNSGDMILSASFKTPQPYWSISKDRRKIIDQNRGKVSSASLVANSWNFYDQNHVLLWYFPLGNSFNANTTWAAVLRDDGFITFITLQSGGSSAASTTQIPQDQCSRPVACDPLFVCSSDNRCQCPSALPSCKQSSLSQLCGTSRNSVELVHVGDTLTYSALQYLPPSSKTDLNGCKSFCLGNCSCIVLFFDKDSGSCYLFDQIGNLESVNNVSAYASYVKISSTGIGSEGGSSSRKRIPIIISIVIVTVIVILGLLYGGYCCLKMNHNVIIELPEDISDEDFLEGLSGKPIRFSYKELEVLTDNFSVIIGHGGFGSVYKGTLADGTQVAVKKLEGLGQGVKEFRAEVSIIGSIHHHHLVRLKGFCSQGNHRLLVYEYMANRSLDSWLFKKNKDEFMLDWDTRYNIAVGTAKGLAYLHEDCDVKIVHCDIKPENVLLDDNFGAKVSDFGLAKLMSHEQSLVFTTLRGTRGYLAPEWITNYAISEKSDVYSYGMVLLEIIGGRKNFDPTETSLKSHFPTYAFKMMEEGRVRDILDARLRVQEEDERIELAIKVALWCIQDDMNLRPPMTRVVQMLEGVYPVPSPPSCNQIGSRFYPSFSKYITTDGTPSLPSQVNDYNLSAVRLSGPR